MSEAFDPYYLWLGIPPQEQPPNHYRLLGVRDFEDNSEVISYALDQRCAHLRSFQAGKRGAESQKLLNEVAAAGVCLLDPAKRQQYDQELRARISRAGNHAPPPAPPVAPATKKIPVARPLATAAAAVAPPPGAPSMSVVSSTTAATRTPPPSSLPMLAAIGVAACVLLIGTATFAGWWIFARSGSSDPQPPLVANVPKPPAAKVNSPPTPKGGENPISKPREVEVTNSAPQNPSIPPPEPQPPDRPSPAPIPTPAPPNPTDTTVWLAEGENEFALRQVNGTWVEFRPDEQWWYDGGVTALPDGIELYDRRRGVRVRLNNRMELKSARQDWAVVAPGHWCPESELPEFARQSPVQPPPGLPVMLPATYALVFCGRETLQMPIPAEIRTPGADFTVEMWVRFDPFQPGGALLSLGGGPTSLATHGLMNSAGATAVALRLSATGNRDLIVLQPDQWRHVALVRGGPVLQLYVDGKPAHSESLPGNFSLPGSHCTIGSRTSGWHGMLRDCRLSRGARYTAPFTPPLRFKNDEQTLALLDTTKNVNGSIVGDLSGHGHKAIGSNLHW
ncbi:MAG TPA: LamG-like jellyroll fold domain-containing protein, partial [Pirellulaceae bacterium]|nr:LamG-like jellyroll fold domain-containing protein [Pirellulaceae bacterium]